ncbi:MAG: flagellar basal body-associated protein FliL [Sandaracinaceae bacterium]
MADDDRKDEAPGARGGGSRLLLAVVAVNILVVLGGVGAVFFVMQGQAQDAEEDAALDDPLEIGPLIEVDGMVVNLQEAHADRYLRCAFHLEAEDEESSADIEARMVPLRSAVLLYLTGLTLEEVHAEGAREAILTRIRELANEVIGAPVVRRAYFAEFVVQ